ncbi:MAG: thioredoxin domain-containing protein [Candidatus Woesebacteria bacterium]|jgi:protein-disulfide isomerase
MNKTRWIIFGVICFAIIAGVIFANQSSQESYSGDAGRVITEGNITDHVSGSDQNEVILIEYADYQCPACSTMNQKVSSIVEKYKDQLTFVFRNLPLTTIHPNSLAAATAVEAAGLQGKYFEMHDKLYSNQSSWSGASISERSAIFESYAQQLGLDIEKYQADLSSDDVANKINRDRATAKSFKITATPTFIINGNVLSEEIALSEDGLQNEVEGTLKDAGLID